MGFITIEDDDGVAAASYTTTLGEIQGYMALMARKHGFTNSKFQQVAHLAEEVGELAKAVKLVCSFRLDPSSPEVTGEFADVLFVLAGLANLIGVDLSLAAIAKAKVNEGRRWGTETANSGSDTE